jgi:hypothetical protein
MSSLVDSSFDGDAPIVDMNSISADFPEEDTDEPVLAAKKLQGSFDEAAAPASGSSSSSSSLKVFPRGRPPPHTTQSTIKCVSDTEIHTTAPDVSNRAKYTNTEERQYVSIIVQYCNLCLARLMTL